MYLFAFWSGRPIPKRSQMGTKNGIGLSESHTIAIISKTVHGIAFRVGLKITATGA